MDQDELLLEIHADVAAIRAHGEDVERRIARTEARIDAHDSRLRKLELVLLPISAGLGWIAIQLYTLLNK